MASKCLFPVVIALLLTTATAAQQATVRPVASVAQLMEVLIIPSSDVVFKFAGEPPKNAEEWAKARDSALTLAESGNLLMIGGRARDQADWLKMARGLVDAAAIALSAVEAKKEDALSDAGDKVIETCTACHDRYLTPSR